MEPLHTGQQPLNGYYRIQILCPKQCLEHYHKNINKMTLNVELQMLLGRIFFWVDDLPKCYCEIMLYPVHVPILTTDNRLLGNDKPVEQKSRTRSTD